jgi:hypothetical protein
MGVPTSEVSYTSATIGRGDHEVHKRHLVALAKRKTSVRMEATNFDYSEDLRNRLLQT